MEKKFIDGVIVGMMIFLSISIINQILGNQRESRKRIEILEQLKAIPK